MYSPQFTHMTADLSMSDKTVAWTLLPYPFGCLNNVLARHSCSLYEAVDI